MQKSIVKGAVFSSLLLFGSCLPGYAAVDYNSHFSAGEKAFAANNFTVAVENFAQALKYVPEDLRSRFRYGQALYSLNRFSESHSQFQAVLQNSPSNIIARVYLAENLLRLNRASEARAHVEWILKVQPDHLRAQQILDSLNGKTAGMAISQTPVVSQAPEKVPQGQKPLAVKPTKNSAKAKMVAPVKSAAPVKKTGLVTQEFVSRPFIAGQQAAPAKVVNPKAVLPAAYANVASFDLPAFIAAARDSFLINLEYARFNIEKGDLPAAAANLAAAEQLSQKSSDPRRFLEVQILNSMVLVYNRDFNGFGQHLMKLKPVLSAESYQSFLDIYNQGAALKDPIEQARLAAGIAMGAGHNAVAATLLQEAFQKYPNDPLIASLLADAQMQNLDYKNAEITLAHLARTDSKNSEAWFNMARFYLTADYKPEQVRKYATYAAKLRPEDSRNSILLALLDYSEGKIGVGMDRMKKLLPSVTDPALKGVCEKILADGETAGSGSGASKINFANVLALPGAPHAPISAYRLLGEDFLRQGSFFTAMQYFNVAQDTAEIGRTYLGIASALNSVGETALAGTAVAFGMKALNQELARNPGNSRANLYLALYYYERGDKVAARKAIDHGLAYECERTTRTRLTAIFNAINS